MTRKRVDGHYARILVDFDLKSNLATDVLVERDNFALYVGVGSNKERSQNIWHTTPNLGQALPIVPNEGVR